MKNKVITDLLQPKVSHPIVETKDVPGQPGYKVAKALIHQKWFDNVGRTVPDLNSPERYFRQDYTDDQYDKLPEADWDIDEEGNITRLDLTKT